MSEPFASYNGINRSINLGLPIDSLPKRQRIDLAVDILREAGILDAILKRPGVNEAWVEASDKYLKEQS